MNVGLCQLLVPIIRVQRLSYLNINSKHHLDHSDTGFVSGWAGWALAYLEYGVSFIPSLTRGEGADYAHPITTFPSEFENLTASLTVVHRAETM